MFPHLHECLARIIDRLRTEDEQQYLYDEGQTLAFYEWLYETGGRYEEDRAEMLKWLMPKQLPCSPETVFAGQFRSKTPRRFFRKNVESMTIDDVWSGLPPRGRNYFTVKAKKNEVCNTARIKDRSPLSLIDARTVSAYPSQSFLDFNIHSKIRPRLSGLQKWYRYRSDHPMACGGRKTPVPEAPFRIMDLPFECRREIFLLVLGHSCPILQFPSDGSADEPQGPVDVRLFAVSKQVFAEAVKIFYEVNTFSISTSPCWYYKAIPLFVRQSTGTEAPRPTDSIKRVHVEFDFDGADARMDEVLFLWRIICGYLGTCKSLRKIEVTVRWWIPPGYEAMKIGKDLQLDKLGEIIMNLRSTNGFSFSEEVLYEAVDEPWTPSWCIRRIIGTMI